jgi:threonylcarbamoyladenosine tRNA methylthiotransferase MtaB
MREAFVSRGAVSVGEEDPADVYIINTCTVTNIADRKSRQYIRRVKRINPDALIVVTGCYAQVEPEEVASMPEVDMVVGNGQKSKICGLVLERLEAKESAMPRSGAEKGPGSVAAETAHEAQVLVLPRAELTEYEDMGLVESGEPGMTRAYIKIQEGCDRFCSYCLIPYARGPVRSRPAKEIVQETRMLLDSGIREIVLTGINTALYGTEEGSEYELTDLLAMLDEIEMPEGDDFRIRLSSLEPTVVDKDHVEKIIRFRRLCHHLHLSVQAGSDHILKSMNRHYTRDEYLDIVRAIRDFDPLYGITTDIIVGFSGETEEDFADTLDIVRKSDFGKVHVFRYSTRKGTAGASLPDAVPGEVKIERSDRLEETAEEVARRFRTANTGITHVVLAEEIQDGYMTGYTGNYIKTYIKDPKCKLEPGAFYKVRLTELYKDGCKGEII